jgi:hypothetical protein
MMQKANVSHGKRKMERKARRRGLSCVRRLWCSANVDGKKKSDEEEKKGN